MYVLKQVAKTTHSFLSNKTKWIVEIRIIEHPNVPQIMGMIKSIKIVSQKIIFESFSECAMKYPICGAFSFQTANGYCLQLSKFSIISPSADYAIGFLQCQIYQGVYYEVTIVRGYF